MQALSHKREKHHQRPPGSKKQPAEKRRSAFSAATQGGKQCPSIPGDTTDKILRGSGKYDLELPARAHTARRGVLPGRSDRLGGPALQLVPIGDQRDEAVVAIARTMPRTSSANRGRAASAVANTSAWLTSSVSLPVAVLVIRLNPRTRIAIWRAATTSGTVDMPTASVPIVRRNLSSAAVSKLGPATIV